MGGHATTTVDRKKGRGEPVNERATSEPVTGPGDHRTASADTLARVEYSLKSVLNMGNYESLHIHVGIVLPSRRQTDSLDLVYDFAREWVESRLQQEIEAKGGADE